MGILEDIIQKSIKENPHHLGTFSDKEIKQIVKDHTKNKPKSLFDFED